MKINEDGMQVDFKLDLSELDGKNTKEKLELLKSNFKSIEEYFNKSFKELEKQLQVERELEREKEEDKKRQEQEKIRKEIGIDDLTMEEIASKDLGVMPLSSWCLITGIELRGMYPSDLVEKLETKYNYKIDKSFNSVDIWDCPMNQDEFVKFQHDTGQLMNYNQISDVDKKNRHAILNSSSLSYVNEMFDFYLLGLFNDYDKLKESFTSNFGVIKQYVELYILHSLKDNEEIKSLILGSFSKVDNGYKILISNFNEDNFKEIFNSLYYLKALLCVLDLKDRSYSELNSKNIEKLKNYFNDLYKKADYKGNIYWDALNSTDKKVTK